MHSKNNVLNFNIFELPLFATVIALLAFGFISLSSAASGDFFVKQIIFALISLVIVGLLYKIFDLEFYERHSLKIYSASLILLLIVKVIGKTALGAQRWISLGPINIQPSEIAKIALIVMLAFWLSKHPIRSFKDIFISLGIVALPAGLVIIQPDLGTTIVFGAISLGMLYWAGATVMQLLILSSPLWTAIFSSFGYKLFACKHPIFSFSITVPVVIFFITLIALTAWHYKVWKSPIQTALTFALLFANAGVMIIRPILWGFLKEYQQKRLTIFLDPSQDPLGAGYHIIQSLYAIGSGGGLGKGLKTGELTQGNFVPEQHTDFIFSVAGEELGFLGAGILVLLFFFLLMNLIKIAKESENAFGSLLVVGVFSMFLFHIFVNIGMTLSLMPITGVPLPFISYGGTSLLVNLFVISLVFKVAEEKQREKLFIK